MFGSGVCCSEMHVRSRPSLIDRLTVKSVETFTGHKVCPRLVRTHLHSTKSVWNTFVIYDGFFFFFLQRMNPMKSSPADSRFWEFRFSEMSVTDCLSDWDVYIEPLSYGSQQNKILMFHGIIFGNLLSSFLWRSGTSSIERTWDVLCQRRTSVSRHQCKMVQGSRVKTQLIR